MLNRASLQTFWAILYKDIQIYNKHAVSRMIDATVWMGSILLVAHYIMPLFGVDNRAYGTFVLLGHLAVWGLFEMLTSVAMFLADLQGDKTIAYYASLPLPSTLLFVEQACASAYRSLASSLLILPLGKLILGDYFAISAVNWPQLILMLVLLNLFYGFFTLFICAHLKDLQALTGLRSRIMFPLWFLGGCQFSWKMLYSIFPTAAYISLCNPLVYIMDGIRSTALPQQDYLPFWLCVFMLIFFSTLFGYLGIKKLKQRLNFI